MFRSKRSGLVRRLWRSRLIPDKDGTDGRSQRSEGDPRDGSSRSKNPEKIPKTELRSWSVTRAVPSLETYGEVFHLPGSADQGDGSEHDRDAMCVPEHRGSRSQYESDSRTVTCCLFRERDPRPRSKDQGACESNRRNAGQQTNSGPVLEQELKNVTFALLKKLKEKPLDALLEAVESKGGMPSKCVLVPPTELRLGGHPVSPSCLLCKLYRWSDLQYTAQLKALCHCLSFGALDSATVCCNPYHYSRLCGPESPPPPYSRLTPSDGHKPLDLSDSTLSYTEAVVPHSPHFTPRDVTDTSTSLCSSSSCAAGHSHWCSVAYWEERTRVGRLYPAHDPSLSIFYDLPQGTGLCLGQFNSNAHHGNARHRSLDNSHQDNSSHGHRPHGGHSSGAVATAAAPAAASNVQRMRSKIGYGIVLSREPDGVWVYNRSQHPVFVHSPTLDQPGHDPSPLPSPSPSLRAQPGGLPSPSLSLSPSPMPMAMASPRARGLTVRRVLPGYSLRVFDYERSSWLLQQGLEPEEHQGPYDPHSVRISFAKGWGPRYSRQFITSCPCWLEVLLHNHR